MHSLILCVALLGPGQCAGQPTACSGTRVYEVYDAGFRGGPVRTFISRRPVRRLISQRPRLLQRGLFRGCS